MRRKNGWPLIALLSTALWACDDTDGPGGSGDAGADGSVSLPQCSNAIDDDGDGLVDLDDPGCDSPNDDDESDEITQCSDGVDNDDDGLIDLQDPACESTADDDESNDPPPPQCANGEDDDGDGDIDLEDRGCANAADTDESDEPPLPACNNGIDDDQDGFTDFPADPGCGSEFDDDEVNDDGPTRPQCGNGIDDDNDGQIDLADPGCTSAADPREQDPEERAACSDGIDNDGDGIIDFPLEPGCASAGDDDETDGPPPACGNGLDDDADGKTDYPEDPGCAGIGDRDETDPLVIPACADGIDNDRDDLIDYPEDRGCESAADGTETGSCGRTYEPAELGANRIVRGDSRRGAYESEGSCGGRGSPEVVFLYRVEKPLEALVVRTLAEGTEVETALYVRRGCLDQRTEIGCNREPLNDGVAANELRIEAPTPGDYYIFLDGASGMGGAFELEIEEVELAQCLNGLDDDEDGRIDYPADPGCERATDRDETDPDPLPACSDDEDNDGDGLVDYPLDVGCRAASDDDEVDLCGPGVRFFQYPVGEPFIIDSTAEGTNAIQGTCGGANAPEKIFLYENPVNANLTISLRHEETVDNTLVYVRRDCQGIDVACNDGGGRADPMESRGEVQIDNAAPGDYFIIVDTRFGLGGQFKLSIDVERLPPGCSDGLDNDEDGFIDADDLGCANADDEDEQDPEEGAPLPQCWNGEDDDGDGIIDYPFEPGCVGKGDDDETDPEPAPACANGIDDDGDELIDFPNDIGCASRGDEDEDDPRVRPRCNNRIDDDDDGLTDYPLDPGCAAAGDPSEADDDIAPACADGEDNDGDNLIDFPFDPGCFAAGHVSEDDPDPAFACSNGEDDDEDGLTDFPFDPGCTFSADDDEADPAFLPQCANNVDDDGDGLVDWPDDRGCFFAGDNREENPFRIPPRCANSVDDDGDGTIDLSDPGCVNREDDDEVDPPEASLCNNGVDDDEDGLTDWPADPGCQGQGDTGEAQACAEVEAIDIPQNGSVIGVTEADDADNYRNRCGGREAPDVVYRYVLDQAGPLTISTENEGTDYPVVLSVRRDCDEPLSELACVGDFRNPEGTIELPNAQPGEYFIVVDGGGPERWVGSQNPAIGLPADPRNFMARNDINANGWSDGGNDAFDGYGQVTITHAGQAGQLDMNVQNAGRQGNAGAYTFTYTSELLGNVWRIRILPAVENDDRPVTISMTGNLGSDGSTVSAQREVPFQGRQIRYMQTADNFAAPRDPPVYHLLVPSDPEQLDAINYAIQGDNPTLTANNITLPATFYIGLSYNADFNAVAAAIVSDLEIQAGGGGPDAPRFGNFELSVQEGAQP